MNSNKKRKQAILNRLQIKELNAMQRAVEQASQQATDIVLLSPTGSGKTLAFLLPLLEQLTTTENAVVQALILAPSRELALQISNVFRSMQTGFKVNCCYGGHSIKTELQNLQTAPSVLVGTPGRIADHLRRGSFETAHIHHLILDEFDKSLEFGFSKEMSFIIEHLEHLQKRVLTSATAALEIPNFVGLKNAVELDFLGQVEKGKLVTKAIITTQAEKPNVVVQLACLLGHEPSLIFCNQRATVEEVGELLFRKGLVYDIFHGGLEQKEREVALIKFKNGSNNLLVTTDLAARGLDISTIKNIIHYQLPHTQTELIHRNGRTARMQAKGTAYLLLAEDKKWREYIDEEVEYLEMPKAIELPPPPAWETLYVSAGKKDKVNKFDIVGTFLKKGQLNKDELGLIVVQEHSSYVAVKQNKVKEVIQRLNKQRIKKKKVLVEIAH